MAWFSKLPVAPAFPSLATRTPYQTSARVVGIIPKPNFSPAVAETKNGAKNGLSKLINKVRKILKLKTTLISKLPVAPAFPSLGAFSPNQMPISTGKIISKQKYMPANLNIAETKERATQGSLRSMNKIRKILTKPQRFD